MDVRFLKEISEVYIMDSGLEQTPDQIFEDLFDIVKFLREYDLPLYNELYETTSLRRQKILKNYLDSIYIQEEVVIEEIAVTFSAGFILSSILALLMGKPAMRIGNKILSAIGESLETLGRKLARGGKYLQIRTAIIYENTRKCYAKCGITQPSDIHFFTPFAIKTSTSFGGTETVEQGKCLRECYIEELIDLIGLHMENYFACLKRTGSFDVVQKTDSDDIMKMVSSTNVATTCESYYTAAREALDNFYRVLELVYDKLDSNKRLEKINKLRSKIYESRQVIQRANDRDMNRYSNEKFPSQTAQQPQFQQKLNRPQIGGQHYNPNFRRT
jgi:hypothetical protein